MLIKRSIEAHEDGWLYIQEVEIAESEPVRRISWWPTGMRVAAFRSLFGEQDLGKSVRAPLAALPYRYETEHGIVVSLRDGSQTRSRYYKEEPIPCPMLKGKQRGLPTRWRGYWQIRTQKGWHAL